MVEHNDHDRSTNGSWWADAFDPVENVRAMVDAQGLGRRVVEDLADQLLASGDRLNGGAGGTRLPNGDLNQLLRQFRADATLAGDVVGSVLDNTSSLLSILINRLLGSEAQAGVTSLVLDAVSPGAETAGVFWVHNTSPAAVPAVRPHCAPLRSHLGCELAPAALRFDPQVLDPLPARSSCGIEVRLRVPPSTAPDTYVSVILASNVPELYLPLCVTVLAGEAEA
ncbi:MAG TPA: hypothetical protein VJT72_23810 [Pseudonocardiaceae bacterium]|nr:hypothetical protein [Pseudonocardiaceae bacterium]